MVDDGNESFNNSYMSQVEGGVRLMSAGRDLMSIGLS